jgi:cytochrome bd-type quinol oxidase subunit 2
VADGSEPGRITHDPTAPVALSPAARLALAAATEAEQDVRLKRRVAAAALALMAGQVLASDLVFVVYGAANAWRLDGQAMVAWLAAAVIEVIGVVVIITRHLFPKRRRRRNR